VYDHWIPAVTPPSDGTWCWTSSDKTNELGLMMADSSAPGGWRNKDSDEDFDRGVRWFWPIELPHCAPPGKPETPEQAARDMLERIGWGDVNLKAQHLSAGDVVELANVIAESEIYRGMKEGKLCRACERPTPCYCERDD
jgi:hypothetical protein